jgi:hypothetical protein
MTDAQPSRAVLETVAEAEGSEPSALTEPLFEAVDPDALDQLVDPAARTVGDSVEVQFEYLGYDVVVTGDGSVSLA